MNYKITIYWISTLIVCFIFMKSSIVDYVINFDSELNFYRSAAIPTFLIALVGIMKFMCPIFILRSKTPPLLIKLSYLFMAIICIIMNLIDSTQLNITYFTGFVCLVLSILFLKERNNILVK